MALDFAVFAQEETAADIVSLDMAQHDELMLLAAHFKLSKLLRFKDYFEEVDVAVAELPDLYEELEVISKSLTAPETAKFACDLRALIELAINRRQTLTAVPD